MKCIKCKAKLPDDSKYCIRCGVLLDDTYFNIAKTKQDTLFEYIIDNEVYNNSINIKYLCFNFAYAFYKRMYKEGIISFLSLFILVHIILNFISLVIGSLGFGFLAIVYLIISCLYIQIKYILNFKNIYIESVYKFVEKTTKNNASASLSQLKSICDKRKKNDLISSVLSIFLFF